MIVVEGFDGSGKSTLATKIALKLGWPLLHTGGPTKDPADVIRCLERSRQRMKMKVVQDRITHISESVYSMMDKPKQASLAIRVLTDFNPGVTVIYCRPPTEVLVDAMLTHQRKEHDNEEILDTIATKTEQLIGIYDTVMEVVGCRTGLYMYDRTLADTDQILIDAMYRRFHDHVC